MSFSAGKNSGQWDGKTPASPQNYQALTPAWGKSVCWAPYWQPPPQAGVKIDGQVAASSQGALGEQLVLVEQSLPWPRIHTELAFHFVGKMSSFLRAWDWAPCPTPWERSLRLSQDMQAFSSKGTSLLSPFFQFLLFLSCPLSMGREREQGSEQELKESLKKNKKPNQIKPNNQTKNYPQQNRERERAATKIPTSALAVASFCAHACSSLCTGRGWGSSSTLS